MSHLTSQHFVIVFMHNLALIELFLKVFRKQSPLNHRESVADVILLFTDGKPNPNAPPEFDQRPVALNYSAILKQTKKVKIVGLAVGTEQNLLEYSNLIEKWSSNPSTENFFESNLNNLESVVDSIVGPLCSPAAGKWMSHTSQHIPQWASLAHYCLIDSRPDLMSQIAKLMRVGGHLVLVRCTQCFPNTVMYFIDTRQSLKKWRQCECQLSLTLILACLKKS